MSEIITAIQEGDVSYLKELNEEGVDFNHIWRGKPLWRYAIGLNKFDILQFFVEKGADVNDETFRDTYIHIAAEYDNFEMLKFLVEMGADVNLIDNIRHRKTPIHFAAKGKNLEIVKYLIEKGANVNQTDFNCKTAIHYANEGGNLEIFKYLIEKGAAMNQLETPIYSHIIASYPCHSFELIKFLVEKGADVNQAAVLGKTPIHVVADADILKFLVEKGADVNQTDTGGKTPFHYAAERGDFEIVQVLFDLEVAVNQPCKSGKIPLQYAAERGHFEIVQYLVEKGSDTNIKDKNNKALFHFAVAGGNLNIVKYLVDKGVDVNCVNLPDAFANSYKRQEHWRWHAVIQFLIEQGVVINQSGEDGKTLLRWAIECLHLELVDFLVQRGADVTDILPEYEIIMLILVNLNLNLMNSIIKSGVDFNIPNRKKNNLLFSAIKKGNLEIVKHLIEVGRPIHIEQTDEYGETLLHYSVGGSLNVVKYIIEKGVNVNETDINGRTALHCAAEVGNLEIVQFLVSEGGDMLRTDTNGNTLLHYSIDGRNLDLVKYLVEKGVELFVNQAAADGRTPLHWAAQGDEDESEIDQGVDLNMIDKSNIDPLDYMYHLLNESIYNYSSEGKNLEIIQFLLDKGANVNESDNEGKTPLHYAAESGYLEIVKYLVDKGSDLHKTDQDGLLPLHHAARSGCFEISKFFIERGSDINQTGTNGESALHCASECLELVQFLVEKGMNINQTDFDRIGVLHNAAECGNFETVQYLVENGADVNQIDIDNMTPLHYAAVAGDEHLETIRYLIKKGADVNQCDVDGKTSLHYIVRSWLYSCTPLYRSGGIPVEIVVLSKHGNTNHVNSSGETPFYLAAINGEKELVKFFKTKNGCIDQLSESKKYELLIRIASKGNIDMLNILLSDKLVSHSKDEFYKKPIEAIESPIHRHWKDMCLSNGRLLLTGILNNIKFSQKMLEATYPSIPLQKVKKVIENLEQFYLRSDELFPIIQQWHSPDAYKGTISDVDATDCDKSWIIENLVIQDTELGKGAFGTVKLGFAFDNEGDFKLSVAVKCLDNSICKIDMKLLANETEILKKMKHPFLVQFFGHKIEIDLENNKESVYLVTEWCVEDCHEYFIKNGAKNNRNPRGSEHYEKCVQQYLKYAMQLLCGIAYIHSQNCVHKDLKLVNILIGANNKIKVADFGLADFYEKEFEETDQFKGTRIYSAPEVLLRPRRYSPASDIFSTALILLEMYKGRLYYKESPFKDIDAAQCAHLLTKGMRPSLDEKAGEDEKEIFEVIKSCWSQNFYDRPSADEAQKRLQKLLEKIFKRNPDLSKILDKDTDQETKAIVMEHLSQTLSDSNCVLPRTDLFEADEASGNLAPLLSGLRTPSSDNY